MFAQFSPAAVLRPYIREYRLVESRVEIINRVLPDAAPVLSFRFRGQIGYPGDAGRDWLPVATLAGLRYAARQICYAPDSAALIVHFHPGGLAAFTRLPLHEAFGQTLPLEAVFPQEEIARVCAQLAASPDHAARIAVADAFFSAKCADTRPDALIAASVRRIDQAFGDVRMAQVARELSISQDAFEKRFRRYVGATPKQYATIIRLRRIVLGASDPAMPTLTPDNGYYDQAHFIKDFKRFTGLTPGQFRNEGRCW